MTHVAGPDRSQALLLPESLDDYVGPENPVRFIEAFVDGLDLTTAGFARVAPKATGRPGYAPTDLLKLYVYGCLNRVRSSRRLEAETHRNVEVTWLLRHLKPDFKKYDPASDSYICPAGQRLHPYSSSLLRGLKRINYVNKLACDDCAIRARCTRGPFRTVSRLENEAALDRMAARLAKRPSILDLRHETAEHPFGSIKQWMNQGAFLMRGLEKVRAEFSLTALACNLRRVLNIVGFAELMAAVMG